MTNNEIFRRLKYTFNLANKLIIKIFRFVDVDITEADIDAWLRNWHDAAYHDMDDVRLAAFLEGFIIFKRGRENDAPPHIEPKLTNNIVLRKIKIAMNYMDSDIIGIMQGEGVSVSKHLLSAFFRSVDHEKYMECRDTFLRKFLNGLYVKVASEQHPDFKRREPTNRAEHAQRGHAGYNDGHNRPRQRQDDKQRASWRGEGFHNRNDIRRLRQELDKYDDKSENTNS